MRTRWFRRRRRSWRLLFRLWLGLLWLGLLFFWLGFVLRRRRLLLWFVFWLRLFLWLGFLLRLGLLFGLWLLSFIDLFIFFFVVADALHENLLIAEVVLAHLVRIFLLRRRWSWLWRGLGLRSTSRG